jgi:hypothetical protein
VDSVTVPAGTFTDVIVDIGLDRDLLNHGCGPNSVNQRLGLDPVAVPYAVTEIWWIVPGVGVVKANDVDACTGEESEMFTLVSYSIAPDFRRGDCNDDGDVDISDASCILGWLFLGGEEPGCIAVVNTNGDSAPDVSDAVYLLSFLFSGGPPPVAPFFDCGPGLLAADEALGCETPPESCN